MNNTVYILLSCIDNPSAQSFCGSVVDFVITKTPWENFLEFWFE